MVEPKAAESARGAGTLLVMAGASHKSAPPAVLEALAAVPAPEALERLRRGGWGEAVVLSTCNRFEAYAAAPRGEAGGARGAAGLAAELSSWAGWPPGDVDHAEGEDAARRLFLVASGLDSLVVGESEILGQVKSAYEAARAAGMTGPLTNVLFQRALFVGKQVRSETGVSAGRLSVASTAVALAGRVFGDLSESRVLILGAGRLAELTAKHFLAGARAAEVRFANRTRERALALSQALASRLGRAAVSTGSWEDLPGLMAWADIVVGSTGSPRPVITGALARSALAARRGRPLLILDLAMPRDAEEAVGDLDNLYLYTLADLSCIVRETLSQREGELSAARRLVAERSSEFGLWLRGRASEGRVSLRHSIGKAPGLRDAEPAWGRAPVLP